MSNDLKPILDSTCGSRMMWFDKDNPYVLYVDKRQIDNEEIWQSKDGKQTRYVSIDPDVIADFTDMPFEDASFYHVVFDPPHMVTLGESSWMCKKYGRLKPDTWKQIIHDGVNECMRVLKPYSTLIFKWCEYDIPVRKILKVIDYKPLYGHHSGKQQKTHWMAFVKECDS